MASGLFDHLGYRISAFSPQTLREGLGIGMPPVPDQLLVRPVDPWPGDAESGAKIMGGIFTRGEDQCVLRGATWEPVGISQYWLNYLHGFSWLRDLRIYGGDQSRQVGNAYIRNWIMVNRDKKGEGWQAGRMGERLSMWISHHDYFGAHDEEFYDLFFPSLTVQARALSRSINASEGLDRLFAAKGLLYAGLALHGYEALVDKALDILSEACNSQILPDGGHVSRSPESLLRALKVYLDVRVALAAGAYPCPEKIQHTIDRMGAAMRFFVYGDKQFGVFNGGGESCGERIDSVLAQAGVRAKAHNNLPASGYERVSQGRTLLMIDTGKSPAWPHDRLAHAAPLSFEMAYGKERIFVNCGAHLTSEEWSDSLRATAAHNTLNIDHRNATEIKANGHFGRKVLQPYVKREESRKACLVEMSHDGYLPLNGITHTRRLFLCEQGTDFRGEDTLDCLTSPAKPLEIAIRFHLHPRVMVSLVQGGEEALLRLPSGAGWRFQHTGGTLALENSVYLGDGKGVRKTKQLVIYGQMNAEHAQVRWALQREGM